MLSKYQTSNTKESKINKYLQQPLKEGEYCYVLEKNITKHTTKPDKKVYCRILSINGDLITLKQSGYHNTYIVNVNDIIKDIAHIGQNPFSEQQRIETLASPLDSILYDLGLIDVNDKNQYKIKGIQVKNLNWNPYVYVNGEKHHYQRDFVWEIKHKQNLIHSIYNNIECGRILVRKRSWKELERLAETETDLAFHDIIDGKQRLNAICDFVENKFPDKNGIFFSDLSNIAQRSFFDHQLFKYSKLPENSTDEQVLLQFLKLNVSGIPQSEEHIHFVESLYKIIPNNKNNN